ncbi:MAG: hypothetical protein LUC85_10995 [Bacteroidales bacterium]|nr:hypothetical protein [Bacteroidales bacterium]
MTTLKAVVSKQRADGFFPVYIRIVHRSQSSYIKTDKVISPKGIAPNGDFKDAVVNEYCSRVILDYTDKLNRKDISANVNNGIKKICKDMGMAREYYFFLRFAPKALRDESPSWLRPLSAALGIAPRKRGFCSRWHERSCHPCGTVKAIDIVCIENRVSVAQSYQHPIVR